MGTFARRPLRRGLWRAARRLAWVARLIARSAEQTPAHRFTAASPAGANFSRIAALAADDFNFASFHFVPPAPTAEAHPAHLLIALLHSTAAGDAHPDKSTIASVDDFWSFLRALFDSRKAALRVVRFTP